MILFEQILIRGFRLIEILKQKRFSPLNVPQQVILVFAGLNGYLDKIPLEKLKFAKRILNNIGPNEVMIEEHKNAPSFQFTKFSSWKT